MLPVTVLSRASAHGCSQLKRQHLRVGGYTGNVLNYPHARAHPGWELSSHGAASSVRRLFVEAIPTVKKAALCYKLDRLTASLKRFHSVQSSLAVRKFRAAATSEQGHGRVCVNLRCLMLWRPKCIRTIAA